MSTDEIRANLKARADRRWKIAALIADARADTSPNETVICFETAEKILTIAEAEATA